MTTEQELARALKWALKNIQLIDDDAWDAQAWMQTYIRAQQLADRVLKEEREDVQR